MWICPCWDDANFLLLASQKQSSKRIVQDFLYVDNAALLFPQISGTSWWLVESVPTVWAHHQSEGDCSALFRCRARIFHQWCTHWELWQILGPGIHHGLKSGLYDLVRLLLCLASSRKNISRSIQNSECTRHTCWAIYFTAQRRGTQTDDRKIIISLKSAKYAERSSAYLYTMGQPQMSTMEGEKFQMRKTACYTAITTASTHKLIWKANRKYSSRICES